MPLHHHPSKSGGSGGTEAAAELHPHLHLHGGDEAAAEILISNQQPHPHLGGDGAADVALQPHPHQIGGGEAAEAELRFPPILNGKREPGGENPAGENLTEGSPHSPSQQTKKLGRKLARKMILTPSRKRKTPPSNISTQKAENPGSPPSEDRLHPLPLHSVQQVHGEYRHNPPSTPIPHIATPSPVTNNGEAPQSSLPSTTYPYHPTKPSPANNQGEALSPSTPSTPHPINPAQSLVMTRLPHNHSNLSTSTSPLTMQ